MSTTSLDRWPADAPVRGSLRRSRALPIGAGLLALLTLGAALLPLGASAANANYTANCSARLRVSPSTTATIKKSVPKGTIVTASETVDGGNYSASCTTSVAGFRWLKIVSVGGRSVQSLYGVDVVYSAFGLYRSGPNVTAPPTAAPATPRPTTAPTAAPATPRPTTAPTAPPPTGSYLFSDEFNGTSLDTSKWRASNYGATGSGRRCCGDTSIQANYASEISVGGGYLHVGAHLINGKWHTGAVDTETKWLAKPGQKWEARIKLPRGYGFWPAFWGYTNDGGEEIDVIEVCSGAPGTRSGNDETLLHPSVHYDGSSPRLRRDSRHSDLSTAWHVFGMDWRSGSIKFYLDGVQQSTSVTTNVVSKSMPIILNFGVGGTWCGNPNSSTPTSAEMLVDWIRVSS